MKLLTALVFIVLSFTNLFGQDINEQKTIIMESIIPNIFVKNINTSIKCYEQLGFKLTMSVPEKGDIFWAMMSNGNVTFMFQSFDSLGKELPEISRKNGGSLLLYIKIKNIKLFHDKIKDKVNIIKGLEKTFCGVTEFSIQDINGYVLTFAEDEK